MIGSRPGPSGSIGRAMSRGVARAGTASRYAASPPLAGIGCHRAGSAIGLAVALPGPLPASVPPLVALLEPGAVPVPVPVSVLVLVLVPVLVSVLALVLSVLSVPGRLGAPELQPLTRAPSTSDTPMATTERRGPGRARMGRWPAAYRMGSGAVAAPLEPRPSKECPLLCP
jgi:hypothetical protein